VNAGDWTAIGTIALAVMTLAAVITTIIITTQDRASARTSLDQERAAADARLTRQLEHSDAQLQAERQAAQDAEQHAEAYAVQVVLGVQADAPPDAYGDPGDSVKTLVVMIANRGKYTVTRVEAQFGPNGTSLIPPRRSERLPGLDNLSDRLRAGQPGLTEPAYGNSLTPWDAGMRFQTDQLGSLHVTGPYAVVRWTDRWGQRWEHKKGEVRKISEDEHWGL
jgi:hypothetical protein